VLTGKSSHKLCSEQLCVNDIELLVSQANVISISNTQSCFDVSTCLVIYVTRLLMHTISEASDDKRIIFNTLCTNISSDGSFGNCLAVNGTATVSPPEDKRK